MQRALLLFWSAWLALVFLSSLQDGFKALGVLPGSCGFVSGDFPVVLRATSRYGTPPVLTGLLSTGLLAWEAASALLFGLAALRPRAGARSGLRYAAFAVGLSLWGALLLAAEVFLVYGEKTW
jgi:hypothetical protein